MAKRRSFSIGADLVGKRILVPRSIFPKERPPVGKQGWLARVIRVSKNDRNGVDADVVFDGYPTMYYFPVELVSEWIIDDHAEDTTHVEKPVSATKKQSKSAIASPSKKSQLSSKSQVAAIPKERQSKIPPTSPAKSTVESPAAPLAHSHSNLMNKSARGIPGKKRALEEGAVPDVISPTRTDTEDIRNNGERTRPQKVQKVGDEGNYFFGTAAKVGKQVALVGASIALAYIGLYATGTA